MESSKLLTPFITREMLNFGSSVQYTLKVTSQSQISGDVTIRGMTSYGMFTYHHAADGLTTAVTETFVLPDVPIFVMAFDESNAFWQGDCQVALDLLANGDLLYHLCFGYVYGLKKVSYPPVMTNDVRPGGGGMYYILTTDPAANVEISHTVPTGEVWRVHSIRITLVTDASAANRTVTLVVGTSGGSVYLSLPPAAVQVASKTVQYTYAPVAETRNDATTLDQVISLPSDLILTAGNRIITVTTNRQATDNFAAAEMVIEKWLQAS